MVLNHSVDPSSVKTQAEVSLYIWIISLIRQFGTLYWLRITGIDDLRRVSNAFRKLTKTSDAVVCYSAGIDNASQCHHLLSG